MKLVSPFILTAVSAGRIRRDLSSEGWTYIEPTAAAAVSGTVEANWYRLGGIGTKADAKAYCETINAGFLPKSTEDEVLHFYLNTLGVANNFWTDYMRDRVGAPSEWFFFPSDPFQSTLSSCDSLSMQGGEDMCYVAHNMMSSTSYCFIETVCDDRTSTGQYPILCLKNGAPPATTAAPPATTSEPVDWEPFNDYIPELQGISYKVSPNVMTADQAHSYCIAEGGYSAFSQSHDVIEHIGYYIPSEGTSGGTEWTNYWTGVKKINGQWQIFQAGDSTKIGDQITLPDPSEGSVNLCDWTAPSGADDVDECLRAYKPGVMDDPTLSWCFAYEACDEGLGAHAVCLRNDDSTTAPPPATTQAPSEINSVIDAWNDMVVFPNASSHGCQCLNLLSPTDQRYPGRPRDELDQVCLDWQNAIKCQRFEGGVCGPMKEDELPSYTNYANCTLNNDPCAAALCEINRKFATDVNNLKDVIIPKEVKDPVTNCTREHQGPHYDSCCFTDIFSSIRYDSAASQCVTGAVEPKYNPEDDGWTLIPANLGTTEGTHYKLETRGNGNEAHAWCADQGGSIPLSTNDAEIKNYRILSGSKDYYWTGFKKTAGRWNADPDGGDPVYVGFDNKPEACAMYHYTGSSITYIKQTWCTSGNTPSLCLKNFPGF